MQWFRVYHHISTDPKLHKAARMAKVARATMVGAFITVLDFASQQGERGSILGLDLETFAFLTGCKPCVAAAMLTAMQNVGLVREGHVTNWAKYQRESDNVAARVRAHRERKASENVGRTSQNVENWNQPLREAAMKKTKTDDIDLAIPLKDIETEPSGNVTLLRGVTDVTDQNQNRTESERESPLTPLPGGGGRDVSRSRKPERFPPMSRLERRGSSYVYPEEFEQLWAAYPAREEDTKDGCYRHFRKQMTEGRADFVAMLEAAKAYRREKGDYAYRFGLRKWLADGHYRQQKAAVPVASGRLNVADMTPEEYDSLYDTTPRPSPAPLLAVGL